MNQKPLFLTTLLLISVIISGCGSPAISAATLTPLPATAVPVPATVVQATATVMLAATPTPQPTVMPTEEPTAAPTEVPTAEPTSTTMATPAPGAVQVSAKDGMEMVYVPAGDFGMGSLDGTSDEQPVHTVTLDAFWIDKTEVTNAMYTKCVQLGACLRPYTNGSNTQVSYYPNVKFANYPVIDLRWSSAVAYCTWAGRRLPTEAEWEKAARGTDGFTYPWGNTNPNSTLLNFNNPAGDAVLVGSYPKGASPYGALDLAGNLREWVADWYDAKYYASSPKSNPTGPAEGLYRVVRGGSWHSDIYSVRSADRQYLAPDARDISVGFRCGANP